MKPSTMNGRKEDRGYIDFGFAKYDHNRFQRLGFPEAIYAPSKTREQLLTLAKGFLNHGSLDHPVIFTRLEPATSRSIAALDRRRVVHNSAGRILAILPSPSPLPKGEGFKFTPLAPPGGEGRPALSRVEGVRGTTIAVITGGTGDIPVAEEAAFTSEVLGSPVHRLYDVGVAGIHRLLENADSLKDISCAIVAAGMEGALPSVVGGLVACPVIGVPTSIGYGVAAGGRVALESMLASCAGNVCVVNIDNGFSAGVIAHLIGLKSQTMLAKSPTSK